MKKEDFTHLHVHTEYSVLDGANRIEPLIERVKGLGMPACAITDHGVLHGAIEFYKEAKKQGVKPIIGCEAYITEDEDGLENVEKTRDNRHMVLLCQNLEGWRNLIWLLNQANLHNFYYKPRIYWKNLEKRNAGLIATSACLAGVVAKNESYEDMVTAAERYAGIFDGRFYLEVQPHNSVDQDIFNTAIRCIAEQLELPMVITTDAHYLRESDKEIHDLLMAQQLKMTDEEYRQSDTMKYEGKFWIREQDEMYKEAAAMKAESAFWNTIEIMERCDLEIKLGEYQTPDYDVSKAPDYEDFKKWQAQNSTSTSDTSATKA